MTQKKFVFRQLSRYICTRWIQFLLQNFHVVSFSDNDDVVCCFVGRGKEKRKRSDSALWQKPLHRQKNPKSNVTTQRTPPKTSITQRLRTDLGRSAGVTIATQLVWLNRFTGYLLCNFSIFFFSAFTERLGGCLYKCGCVVKFSILMSTIRKNSSFQSLIRACTPTPSLNNKIST